MRIRQSSINAFLRCRTLWDYSDQYRQNREPLAMVPAFFLGLGIHKALEEFYQPPVPHPPVAVFQQWVADEVVRATSAGIVLDAGKCLDMGVLGSQMLDGYLKEYGNIPSEDRDGIKVLATEVEFSVPIPNTKDGWFDGRIDGILRDKDGLLWIFEHKTFSQAPRQHALNLQTLAYTWAMNRWVAMGEFAEQGVKPSERVYGSLYNGLRKQAPSPRVTSPLFIREWVMRNQRELSHFEGMLPGLHDEMANPNIKIYPSMTQDCTWCSYYEPCMATITGADGGWILENLFQKRQ